MRRGDRAAQHLPEHRVESAELRKLRRVAPVGAIDLDTKLLLREPVLVGVQNRMGESDVLREQHERAHELQQSSFYVQWQSRHRQQVGEGATTLALRSRIVQTGQTGSRNAIAGSCAPPCAHSARPLSNSARGSLRPMKTSVLSRTSSGTHARPGSEPIIACTP